MLLAHDVSEVVGVLFLADCAVSVLFVRPRKNYFWFPLLHISDVLQVICEFLFFTQLESSFIDFKDEGRGKILFIKVEDWEGSFGKSRFAMEFGAEGGRNIVSGFVRMYK